MLSFLSSCKVSNPRTPLLARTTPSRYPPHTAYGLTNPNASEDRKPSPEAKEAVHNLKVINDSIAHQNKEHKLDTDLGKI